MDSIQKNNIIVPKLNLNLEAKYSEVFGSILIPLVLK
jgi:hypothetical protein